MCETWGRCKECMYWQIEPDAEISASSLGTCGESKLAPFQLSVKGGCGCVAFMPGLPERRAGASVPGALMFSH